MSEQNYDFSDLKQDVKEIKGFLLGDEYRKNGIKHRVECLEHKDKKRDKRFWIAFGAGMVIIFVLKWGDKIL